MGFDTLFKIKIFLNNEVYLLLDDVDKLFDGIISKKYPWLIFYDLNLGKRLVSQQDFNHVLTLEPKTTKRAYIMEVTRVDDLRCRVKNVVHLTPMIVAFGIDMYKQLAAQNGCSTVDEYVNNYLIKEKIAEEYKKIITKSKECYVEDVKNYKKGLKKINETLKSHNLALQCFSYFEEGELRFESFIVGVGVFYQVYTDTLDYYEIEEKENELIIFDDETDNKIIRSQDNRDYRNHNAISNILYVLTTKTAKKESEDDVLFTGGGIDFCISDTLALYLLNPRMFIDVVVFNGIVDIKTFTVIAGNNEGYGK